MDQSDRSIGVEYFSIFHPNIAPLVLGMLLGASLRIPVVAIEAGMDTVETRVNKHGYFVVLTYPS